MEEVEKNLIIHSLSHKIHYQSSSKGLILHKIILLFRQQHTFQMEIN